MLRRADRPPSSIASSVIWASRRDIALSVSSSFDESLLSSLSSGFVAWFRGHAVENRLDAGAIDALMVHNDETPRNVVGNPYLPVILGDFA